MSDEVGPEIGPNGDPVAKDVREPRYWLEGLAGFACAVVLLLLLGY